MASLTIQYFRRYLADWALILGLELYVAFIGLRTTPFLREFSLKDPSIQHPFSTHEQVGDIECLFIAASVPLAIICLRFLIHTRFNPNRATRKQFHLTHVSILSVISSISITGFIVVVLKNWIARPRPDFLARCVPDLNKLVVGKDTYTIDVCTGSMPVILEGLRSTPSGHSALSFAGLHFITIWIFAQFDVLSNQFAVWKLLLCTGPEWIAVWIALSRTQDYRHHFGDITMGAVLEITVAHLIWKKMFKGKEAVYLETDKGTILPLHNTVS